ncbi:CAP domain-containing protein [Synechococcus sp. R6-6]|uniref:CAP domain-containing protein n=1 Tax=unclassified Synechococcus TaxID=2626047 RepID=UPI0039C30269
MPLQRLPKLVQPWALRIAGIFCLCLLAACGGSPTSMEPPRAGEVPIASFLCRLDRQTRSFTGPIYAEQPQVATCNPGRLTPAAAQKMMDRLNFLRLLHQLPPVKLNPQFLEAAQQAALMQVANGTLSHQPPPSWRCFTPAGEAGSRFSNLAVGPILELNGPDPGRVLARQVDIYFAEPGRENFVDVGHRRWNLYPQYAQGAYGIVFDPRAGRVTQANANWIFGFDESVPDPEFIAFPEKDGYLYRLEGFSGQPLSAYRWSFSVPSRGGKADLSQAQVRITDALSGEPVPVGDLRVGDPAFGLETLTYSVGSIQPNRNYTFEISGIRLNGGPPRSYRYTTALYDCDPQTSQRPAPLTEGLGIPPRLLWQMEPFNSFNPLN